MIKRQLGKDKQVSWVCAHDKKICFDCRIEVTQEELFFFSLNYNYT